MTDEDDALASEMRRRETLGRLFKLAIYCSPLLMIGFCSYRLFIADMIATKYRLTEAQRSEVAAAIASARSLAEQRERAYQAAVRSAGALGPRPDLGGCPLRLGVRLKYTKEGWQSPQHNQQFPWRAIARTSTAAIPESAGAAGLRISADFLERELNQDPDWTYAQGPEDMVARAHALPEEDTIEVIVMVDRRRDPQALGTAFISGELAGTAFLYDHESARIICAGDVDAKSSENVAYQYYQHGPLDLSAGYSEAAYAVKQDFAIEVERAIAMSMDFVAGPKE